MTSFWTDFLSALRDLNCLDWVELGSIGGVIVTMAAGFALVVKDRAKEIKNKA